MTALTIEFQPNKLGLETWYVNQDSIITEVVPSSLNYRFKGAALEAPSPCRKNVNPCITLVGHTLCSVLDIPIRNFEYTQKEQPEDLAQ